MLGVFVLQRHRGARIALSVVAVPILLANLVTAPLTGGLLGALIAAATVMLWTGPARDWFAGRPVRQPPVPPSAREEPPPPNPTPPPVYPPVAAAAGRPVHATPLRRSPPATSGFGERPAPADGDRAAPQQWAPPSGPPIAWQQPARSFAMPDVR